MEENTSIIDYEKFEKSRDLYRSLRKGHKTKVMEAYDEAAKDSTDPDARLKLIPTVHDDTILHMAIYMDKPSIAEAIIEKCSDRNDVLLTKRNDYGNTALHEAAATKHTILVMKLLEKAPALLSMANKIGEMPLYTAAYFGKNKNFDLLAKKVGNNHEHLHSHLCSLSSSVPQKVNGTVLHAAIHAEFFELALRIAKAYGQTIILEDKNSMSGLHLLASNPSAFKSGTKYGRIKRFIYYCAPSENAKEEDDHEQNRSDDSNAESPRRATLFLRPVISFLRRVISSEWRPMQKIYEDKKRHGLALQLAKVLIEADYSWDRIRKSDGRLTATAGGNCPDSEGPDGKSSGILGGETTPPYSAESPDIPLFLATSHGISEIVEEILKLHRPAFEYRNDMDQNILHIAIKHRQSRMFDLVMKKETPKERLVRQIDKDGYTILHQVGNMDFYNGGTQPGPALQLQEELEWFEKVEKIIPPHYASIRDMKEMATPQDYFYRKYEEILEEWSTENVDKIEPPHRSQDKTKKETPKDYFGRTHSELLKEAQEWLKQTSESCSTVAGLMSTVAFAAAFTVPGGNDDKNGQPLLIHHPFFLVFIITDALSLASSLTSLVMFLSILTSPFELHDFRHSLPRKLIFGFTFLFFSVAVTMLAFASTLMLTIPIKKRLTTSLIYCVAFLPVTMFALLQFPLYAAFKTSLESSLKVIPFRNKNKNKKTHRS
ncbi:hypothetical protein M0R45_012819 [Rubus argutus]|uniref:PGG domain-containing protein n=1 Tax=Rubus argutus TaxID=59490 RepID=A0AAW1XHE8_RUBAR